MSEQIVCPKCGSVKLVLQDYEPLATNCFSKDTDFLEFEVYGKAECLECGQEFKILGDINWKISK